MRIRRLLHEQDVGRVARVCALGFESELPAPVRATWPPFAQSAALTLLQWSTVRPRIQYAALEC